MVEKNISWISFIIFFLVGVVFNLIGISIVEIAYDFKLEQSTVGYIFAFFNLGVTVFIYFNGYILKKIKINKCVIAALIMSLISVAGIILIKNTVMMRIFMFFYGGGIGILMSSANYIIVKLYGEKSGEKLNTANLFFSAGAVISPFLAGEILKLGLNWKIIYLFVILTQAILIGVMFITKSDGFAVEKYDEKNKDKIRNKTINIKNLFLLFSGGALFSYVVSEMIFSFWITAYLVYKYKIDTGKAGVILSLFWGGMMIGRYFAEKILRKIEISKYIKILFSIATVSFFMFFIVENYIFLMAITIFMGIGYSGIYASVLAYGTLNSDENTISSMTFMLTAGSMGSVLSSPLSSYLRKIGNPETALKGAFLFIIAAAILFITAEIKRKVKLK